MALSLDTLKAWGGSGLKPTVEVIIQSLNEVAALLDQIGT